MNLKIKLILILSFVLIVSFMGANIGSYFVSKKALSNAVKEETLPLITDRVHSEIRRQVMQYIRISSVMAHDTFVKNWIVGGEKNSDEIVEYLYAINEEFEFSSTFLVSEKSKKYYYYDGIFKEVSPDDSHDVWYYDFLALNTDYDLDVDYDQVSENKLTVFINHRLLDVEGNLLGVVGVGIEMKNIEQILSMFQKEFNRLIFLVNSAGEIQIHPDESKIETSTIADLPELSDIAQDLLIKDVDNQLHSFVSKYNGGIRFITTRYFPDIDWFLIVIQDESSVLKDVRTALAFSLIIGFAATCFVLFITIWTVNRFQGRLEIMATTDSLTGLFNRRYFMDHVNKEITRAERTKQKLSLVIIDLDKFKNINDSFGHTTGDKVLREMAKLFSKGLRKMDILSRVGGEEFALLLPETDRAGAVEVAERIRSAVESDDFELPDGSNAITISAGVAESDDDPVNIKKLYGNADNALYEAKRLGRNRVCAHKDET
jgi:diguanylate cyclase (GGDEF)-like protein